METVEECLKNGSVDQALQAQENSTVAPATPHNWCTTCEKDFGSVRAFDRHRVGKYQYSAEHPDGRRCLSTNEMSQDEFVLNSRGVWSLKSSLESAKKFDQNASER